jgi:hypothetical protein
MFTSLAALTSRSSRPKDLPSPGVGTDPPDQETIVSLDFLDLRGATEIVLSYGRFPDAETRDKHNHGWFGCLDQFQEFLER